MSTLWLALLLQPGLSTEKAGQPTTVSKSLLDQFCTACGTPKKWLRQRGGADIQFQPSRLAKYAQVDCLLQHLKDSNVPMNFGFVGNEALPDAGKK